jgi:hypothetical protein
MSREQRAREKAEQVLPCQCPMRSQVCNMPLPFGFPQVHYADCLSIYRNAVAQAMVAFAEAEVEQMRCLLLDVRDSYVRGDDYSVDTFKKIDAILRQNCNCKSCNPPNL